MKWFWSNIYFKDYSKQEWIAVKLIFILYWLKKVLGILFKYQTSPLPVGILKFLPMSVTVSNYRYYVILLSILLVVMYLTETKMVFTSLAIFLLSVLVFSFEESNGILNRFSVFSFIFFAQFIAYILLYLNPKYKVEKTCMQFSVQVIAAAYILSALSKLSTTGINWIFSGQNMALQVIKSFQYAHITTGEENLMVKGLNIANFILNYPNLINLFLLLTILLELNVWLACQSKKAAFIYGCLLLAMHFFIYLLTNINLSAISYPMFIYFLFPVFINFGYFLLKKFNMLIYKR